MCMECYMIDPTFRNAVNSMAKLIKLCLSGSCLESIVISKDCNSVHYGYNLNNQMSEDDVVSLDERLKDIQKNTGISVSFVCSCIQDKHYVTVSLSHLIKKNEKQSV